jgi:acetyl esterase/lipase
VNQDSGLLALSRRAMLAALPLLGSLPAMADTDSAKTETDGTLHLPARAIPLPRTISPEAQAFLATGAATMMAASARSPASPAPSDKAGWKAYIAVIEKSFEPAARKILASAPAKVEQANIGGAAVAVGTPDHMLRADRARLIIHGGGFAFMGGIHTMGYAATAAAQSGCTAYAVDYRRPPDHPFPAALDDCVAVYRALLERYDPRKIAISGESSGGNLTAAAALKIRELGVPLPGAVGMLTPVTDMTQSGDTHQTNFGVDVVLSRPAGPVMALYADGHDLKDPYLSPLFGDFTRGFPPTFLQSGTRDLLLSDTVRMHAVLLKAGVEAELHVWEAMPHAGFGGATPEDAEVVARFQRFLDKHLA